MITNIPDGRKAHVKCETGGQYPDCAMHYPFRTHVRATTARLFAGDVLQRLVGRGAFQRVGVINGGRVVAEGSMKAVYRHFIAI